LFDNPVFAGGIGLAGLGATAALGRRWAVQGAGLIKRRLLVDLEISKEDPSYPWILAWLTLPRPQGGFIISKLTRIHHLSMKTTSRAAGNRPNQPYFMAQPGYGRHIIRHKNAYVSVNRAKQTSYDMKTGEPFETVTLTTLYAHRNIFEDIFKQAHELAASAQEGKTIMYTTRGTAWEPFGDPRKKRPLQSVILDRGIKERIVADVKDFLRRQEWYVDRGIPYRRGYLLYGPPGSGKSSFIQALAGELDFGVAIINLSERGMTDDRLAHFLTKLPARTILLLEDADAAFNNRRQVDGEGFSGMSVTFSGLLNALDGVAAGEERIAFLTTNHIDRLDEALIRPGRVDMTVRIGEATRHQAGEMWDRFYGDIDHDGKGRQRFLQRLEELGLVSDASGKATTTKLNTSTAAIQGLFLFNKDNMDGAIEMAEGLIPKIYEPEIQEGMKVPA
jgi:mitochondrial chaperone BCS1